MSYLSFETSAYSGQPAELYRFALGAQNWYYTSARETIEYLGSSYAPVVLSRSGFGQTKEFGKAPVTLNCARDFPVAALFLPGAPDGVVSLTIYRRHAADPEFITYWKGRVVSASFSGAEVELSCEPLFTGLKRAGLRARYQINCRHVLYGVGCGLTAEAWRVSATLTGVTGAQLQSATFSAQADGWFKAGYVAFGQDIKRLIVAHTGNTVTLSAAIPGLIVGDAVWAYAGCDHAKATCDTKFANLLNYGGFPYIPKKNPFSGDAIV